MKNQINSGFSLIEMLVALAIFGLIALGTRTMLLRAQEGSVREGLRKNHAEMSQDLARRLNHHFKRQTAHTITAANRLVMMLPSGRVVVETLCVKNEIDWQASEALLNRCIKCGETQHPVIRIQDPAGARMFPAGQQKPDRPAAASICFGNGSDPNEVATTVEMLVVDPVNRKEKKVSKVESFLIKDSSSFTSFE
ncbi:MAG TPA: prepilin-type N-terminal cleavage/methylation domain-containing protein [Oligoflexus sp.]|uniref:prepilin-type N-terminal cleavage/methylation domain-containing protein n=1 Tax=Oligoflexus sp. TaxID=1971216 RepID=UPI002D7F2B33|nr:prepilin-type N-terminal cleavage/methylation domain-containing protein [Oligoflexus sp.]HET9239488.1 prepilin-type N-terminal cleavage/methylation domain-containing protein [Oligoflexus sp.]